MFLSQIIVKSTHSDAEQPTRSTEPLVRVPTSDQPALEEEEEVEDEDGEGEAGVQPEGGWALDMPAAVKVSCRSMFRGVIRVYHYPCWVVTCTVE